MSPFERNTSIAFLLSFGAMPTACLTLDDGKDSDTDNSSNATNNDDDSAGDDDDGTGNGPNASNASNDDGSGAGDDVADDASDVADEGSGAADDANDAADESGGPAACENIETPAVCIDYAAKIVECVPEYAMYQQQIVADCACKLGYYAGMYGAGCPAAVEDYYACISGTACADLSQESCSAEVAAQETACGGDEGGATESG